MTSTTTSMTSTMTARDFLHYLLGREQTHDLALQLAYVHDLRQVRNAS
jgi:Mn-containing catalase